MFRTLFFILPLAVSGTSADEDSRKIAEEYARMLVAVNETNETLLIGTPSAEPAPPPPAPPATPAPTEEGMTIAPTPAPYTIKQEYTIAGIEYSALDDTMKTALQDGIKTQTVSDLADVVPGITADQVTVTLSAGSVKVEIEVADVPAAIGTMIESGADTSAEEVARIVAYVETIVADNNIPTTGTLGVSGIAVSSAVQTPAPTPSPPDEGVASSAFSEQVPLAAKVAVAVAGVALTAMA